MEKKLRGLLVLLSVFACAPLHAATYYVDPAAGNDAWNGGAQVFAGGSTGPWQHVPGTLLTASPVTRLAGSGWGKLSAGDSVVVKGGSLINGSIQVDTANYNDGAFGSTIRIISGDLAGWGSGRAVIDGGSDTLGSGPWPWGFHVFGPRYIRIEGFEIRNMNNSLNSSGVLVDGNNTAGIEIVGNLIHEIYGGLGPNGYGIEVTGGTMIGSMIVEKNVIYHTEEKGIEFYNQGYSTIRYNLVSQTNDHGIVISSANNTIYGNIVTEAGHTWLSYEDAFRPSYGIKFDGSATVLADNNELYNNLVLDCSSGIGILNGNRNRVYFNTVYDSGNQGFEEGGFEGSAFVIIDDGTAGTNIPSGNDIRDNIFYFGNVIQSHAQTVAFNTLVGRGNTLSHNLIYRDAATTGSLVYVEDGGVSRWFSVDWLQGPAGFSAYGTGNAASDNVVADPRLAGGIGPGLQAAVPTGFDSSWRPNSNALAPTAASPTQVRQGDPMGSPFNVDITGRVRTLYSIGAYEQTTVPLQAPPAPTHLRLKN
jgi:parallel beta-helix repeat protein